MQRVLEQPRVPSTVSGSSKRLLATILALCSIIVATQDARALPPCSFPAYTDSVDVYITADNAYNFGFGPVSGLDSLQNHGVFIDNCMNQDIFSCATGPETYLNRRIANPATDYLYIITYSDQSGTQGLLARVINPYGGGGETGYDSFGKFGAAHWEVYATYIDTTRSCTVPPNQPSLATINAQIALANSTGGWVTTAGGTTGPNHDQAGYLQVGEANDALPNQSCSAGSTNNFPQVCVATMGTTPRWIWFNPNVENAFCGNVPGGFLIFRIPASALALKPCPAPALSTLGATALALALMLLAARELRRLRNA